MDLLPQVGRPDFSVIDYSLFCGCYLDGYRPPLGARDWLHLNVPIPGSSVAGFIVLIFMSLGFAFAMSKFAFKLNTAFPRQ